MQSKLERCRCVSSGDEGDRRLRGRAQPVEDVFKVQCDYLGESRKLLGRLGIDVSFRIRRKKGGVGSEFSLGPGSVSISNDIAVCTCA